MPPLTVVSMTNSRFLRKCAVPVAAVGMILGGLVHAAPASADETDGSTQSSDDRDSPYYGPDTYAGPGYDYAYSGGPGGDYSVDCSPCA